MGKHRSGVMAVLAVGALSVIAGLLPGGARAASAAPTVYQASDLGVVAPSTGQSSSTGQAPADRSKGARLFHQAGAAGAQSAAQAATVAAPGTSNATVLHDFNGVSSLDSEVTNYRLRFEPPDPTVCAGNGFLLEAVNSAYRIYRPDGHTIVGPFNINDLFNEGGQEFTSDPRCYYDAKTNSWFAVILFISADSSSSHLDIAVNPSGDPTTLWREYRIDTTNRGGNGCPCFGDQPHFGIDQYNFYVSDDDFSILGPQFNGASIYAFAKSDLIKGTLVHFAHFSHLHIAGVKASTIEPAISTGNPAAEYLMNSLDPNFTFDNRIGVWALTQRQNVASGGAPVLSSTVVTTESYGAPVPAVQRGSSTTINAGDDRMQQTQWINGNLWGELTTALTVAGDSTPRDAGAWFDLRPTVANDVIATAPVANQGYVSQRGAYVIYPALQADAAGRAAMAFTLTSSDIYPSAAFAVRNTGQSQFGAPVIDARGSGPYDPKAGRWGDYSWAVLNPASDDFWLVSEYIPPKSSQTTTGRRNWGTRVMDVSVS